MVKILNNNVWKANDFYKTIFKEYNEDGLHVLINAQIQENRYKREEEQLEVEYHILEPINKAIMSSTDEIGNTTTVTETDSENIPEVVRGWLNLSHDKKGDNEFIIFPTSKAYPLINFALIQAEIVPEGNNNGFCFDWDEIQDPLQELECNLRVEKRKGTNKAFFVPVPEVMDDV